MSDNSAPPLISSENTWTNPPSFDRSTVNHIAGGAAFGLAARCWQLGILKKPMRTNPAMHALSMASWGFIGYWVWRWDIRSRELLEEKKAQIEARQGAIRGLSLPDVAKE